MTKVLIHGATNWGSSNFGDYLYVDATIRRVKQCQPQAQIRIAEPSEFFLKYLRDFSQASFRESEADIVIYAPGGYFGEGHGYRFRDAVIHFVRFMPVGIRASFRKQRIVVIGVGAGPITYPFIRWAIKRICGHAENVSVRDIESLHALQDIGVQDVTLAFDPIISIPLSSWMELSDQVQAVQQNGSGEVLLVHYNHSEIAMKYFAEAVKRYVLQSGVQVNVVVASDQELITEDELYMEFCQLSGLAAQKYTYKSPYEMLGLINICDCVLTCKLHVGVVGTMLGSSVICAAEHPEKSKRYYQHIGCPERCFSLYESTPDKIAAAMTAIYRKPLVKISDGDVKLAEIAWKAIDRCLR